MTDLSTVVPLAIAGVALLVAGYVGARGLGWLAHRERPEKIVGKLVEFRAVESDVQLALPTARVASFDGHTYAADLTSPVQLDGSAYSSIRFSARHRSFAVSSASSRGILGVNGEFPNGHEFTACIVLA
jgi:hypothetical protein